MRRSAVPEVLAPAGDMEALRAAVDAGADAVYFGLANFNARARAKNFDDDSLEQALRHLHDYGVRGYVALNTLVFDDDLGSVERQRLRTASGYGVVRGSLRVLVDEP